MLKLAFLGLTIAIFAACGVYGLKNRVQDLERELVRVERKIAVERIEIKRLKAEWATLTHPERLSRLAATHLGLVAATPLQVTTIDQIPLRKDRGEEGAPALVSAVGAQGSSLRQ